MDRAHDRVAALVCVRRGVAPGRRVAAAHVTAGQADAQMAPLGARPKALLTAVDRRRKLGDLDRVQMCAARHRTAYRTPMNDFVSRGFRRRRTTPEELADRVPPGQYVERGFPVLTAGPTPHVETESWQFKVDGMVGAE